MRSKETRLNKIKGSVEVFLQFILPIVIFFGLISAAIYLNTFYPVEALPPISSEFRIPQLGTPPTQDIITAANERKGQVEAELKRQAELRKIREDSISRLLNYLKKQKSPVATYEYAAQIVDLAKANKADFRIVTAIMGAESGFCRKSFWFNCFGYLNGVRYSSYTSAFNDLVPKVSRQYAAKYGWNFEALAKAYGQINWQHTSSVMRGIANSI